ncbi:MAG: AAA family ATPase [Treponema sp.]|nr:AAA family ATPase [Treponema sp.]
MEFVEAVFYRKLTESDFKKMYKIEKPASGGGQTYIEVTGIKDSELSKFLSYGEVFDNTDPAGRQSYRIHAYSLGKDAKTGENSESENSFLFFNPRHGRNYCITNQTPDKRHFAWTENNAFPIPKTDREGNYSSDVLSIVKDLTILIIRTSYKKYYAAFVDSDCMPEEWGDVPLLNKVFTKDNERRGIIYLPDNAIEFQNDKDCPFIQKGDFSEIEDLSPTATPFTSPEQIIYYGVPGSGKSHEIKHKLEEEYKIPEQQQDVFVERTVFHPEYTNADFIGQIMPKLVQGKTDFVFKPGPFTSILKKALCDSQNRYVLIIEEINRGNAAAIFGELFQLLDRIDDASKKTSHEKELNTYGKGWSEYFVMNSEINNYIRDSDDSFDGKALDLNGIHFSANTGIRLPPNLSILATMNTSDQNVFTLDNAFQRRWDMKLIENVFGDTEEETNQRNAFVDSAKQITWEKFQTAINIKIGKMSEDAGLSSMEDKRLGCWFVKAEKQGNDYIISKDLFAEKVLKYLWDDAFKFCREKVFNGYTNLESLTRDFKGDKEFSVFKDLFSETKN